MSEIVKMIVLSDVHLETSKRGKLITVLDALNKEVERVRLSGFYPVVVCAGDFANGTNAYEMLSQINTDVVYVAGNHEFWEGDFYEVNEALIKNAPSNVHYLYNNFVEIKDTVFAGSIMWTDVGENTNPDVAYHCTHTMRDVGKITAKKWYENRGNLERLKDLYSKKNAHLEAAFYVNAWNILIEREENKKTANFFDVLAACVIELKATQSQETIDEILNKKFTYSSLLKLKADGHEKLIRQIWRKISKVDVKHKKFVAVTHHLPFFEELSVGGYYKNSEEIKYLPSFLNTVDKAWLNVSSGEDYGIEGYFYSVSKGEYMGYESIPKIFHYMNNGVRLFSEDVPKVFKNWIHGHEHRYSFIDYVKGIKICTSPMGSVSASFSDTEMLVRINQNATPEEKLIAANKIKQSFYAVVEPIKETDKKIITSWCWYLLREKRLLDNIEVFERSHKKKIFHLKKLWKDYVNTSRISPLIAQDVQIYEYAQRSAFNEIRKTLNEMRDAVNLRSNENYSYINSMFTLWKAQENFDTVLNGLSLSYPEVIDVENLLAFNRNVEKKTSSSIKEVLKLCLIVEESNFNNVKYLKYAAQYYADAFKSIEVYSFSAFENEFHNVKFNETLYKRMENQYLKLKPKNSFEYNLGSGVVKVRKKNLVDKFFD